MDTPDKIYIESEEEDWDETKVAKKKVRLLVFMLGDETYCVDVRQAKEVMRMPGTTRVPNVPPFVVGVANLRGEIISILELHYFFGVEPKGKTRDARIIITDVSGENIGLMVDQVKDTLEIEEECIQEPLATLKGKLADCTQGQISLGNDILIFLDLERVLQNDEIRSLRKGRSV